MAIRLLIIISLIAFQALWGQNDTLYVASWNVENLFDTIDDPDKRDEEYTPEGRREWTDARLDIKLKNLASVVDFMNGGKGPDLLAVQEVEHRHLLAKLEGKLKTTKNYRIVYAESPDNRGIDNALFYNTAQFDLIESQTIEVALPDKYPTRYILYAKLVVNSSAFLHVFVNHWPSRRGGQEKSEPNRVEAAKALKNFIDENITRGSNIIILGDFNDEPENNSVKEVLSAHEPCCSDSASLSPGELYNAAFKKFKSGEGTYLYRGDWNMLDQIITSFAREKKGAVKYVCGSFEIVKPEFLIQSSGKYKGSALPTFGGRTYLGGYSDHYPVAAKFIFIEGGDIE